MNVITNPNGFSDADQAYLAGCVEGFVTQDQIWDSWPSFLYANYHEAMQVPQPVVDWINANDAWVLQQIKQNPNTPLWQHVGLLYDQLAGIIAGYKAAATPEQQLTRADILLLNADGDLEDINSIAAEAGMSDEAATARRLRRRATGSSDYGSHCSVLIKLTDDYGDLFAGHTTWSQYAYMLRIYKSYVLNFKSVPQAANQVQFSGYPATLTSIDDWYLTSAQLMVTETTNGFFNASLKALIKPQSLLSWVRAGIANRMASGGQEWSQVFAQYNSGTYSNQWIIVDYKRFTPFKAPLNSGLLWIAEQMPGHVEMADKTHVLALGYWPSYNVPYFENIFTASGFGLMVENAGVGWSWELAPRAKIFRRDHFQVQTLSHMMSIMRYNNYANDPFGEGNPMHAISSRADLPYVGNHKPHKQNMFGGIDSKITSYQLMQSMTSMAQSGPTHDQQQPFRWSQRPEIPHPGQPEVFEFDYVSMQFPTA